MDSTSSNEIDFNILLSDAISTRSNICNVSVKTIVVVRKVPAVINPPLRSLILHSDLFEPRGGSMAPGYRTK